MAQAKVNGLEAIKLLQWLDLNATVAEHGANIARGSFNPSFVAMARKDVRLMLETVGNRPLILTADKCGDAQRGK